jgi:hypothetical protein
MKKLVLLLPLLLSTATLWSIDVTGRWSGSLTLGDQSFPWFATFTQNGATLTGKMGPEKASDQRAIEDGKVEDSTLRFRVPGGDGAGTEYVTVELRVENDVLVGTLQGKDRSGHPQTFTLSLKRAKSD